MTHGRSREITIGVITTERELLSMRDSWNALLAESRADTLFLTWEWITTWWSIYARRSCLHILVAHAPDGGLVGIAPLKRTPRTLFGVAVGDIVEFIGYGGDVTPEHLDFIVRRGWEDQALPALVARLRAHRRGDDIDLRPLCDQSPTVQYLGQAFSNGRARCTRDSIAPVLQLPATAHGFMTTQSKNYRKKLGEYERRCERDLAARVRVTQRPEDLERDLAALARLHRQRWKRQSRAFRSARYLAFHQRFAALMLERGCLRLFSLEAGDTRLASLYCFSYGGRYFFYQSGRNPRFEKYRVGLVLMHRAILHAIADGAAAFDFLRGAEHYKYRWATGEAHNLRFACHSSVGGHLLAGLRSLRILGPEQPSQVGGRAAAVGPIGGAR